MMMNPKAQYKSGERISNEAGDNTRFDLKLAEEIASEIARKLFGLWDWQGALKIFYAPSGLESLANRWLRTHTAPELAYARVVEIAYPAHMSKYMAMHNRKMGSHEMNP
jgi:hypothetical protein